MNYSDPFRPRPRVSPAEEGPSGDESAGSAIHVALIDALPTVRAGLRLLLSEQPDMEVVSESGTADEAISDLRQLRERSHLLVLLGLGLSGQHDSFWLIRKIREMHPTVAIVGCGAQADKVAISRALFMGADGFVDKQAHPADFLAALRDAAAGEIVLVGPPTDWVGPISVEIERQRVGEATLSPRQVEVLTLAADGITAREIGEKLGLQERTVTTHLGRIYSRLGVGNRLAAITAAVDSGLIPSHRAG